MKEKEKLREIFPKLTALILNKQEAADFDLKEQADQGPEILVITNGRQGAKLFSEKESFFAEDFLGPVVDETGAGDAFSAGFVAGLVKGRPLAEALKLGMANGAAVVGQFGAKPGLLQEKEIDEWLKKDLRIEKLT